LLSVLIEEAAVIWRGTVDEVLNEDMPPMATLELLIDAAIVLQLRNGNLRDVFVKEYRSLDDDARRRVARIERVRMAEWVHLLCEVSPGLGEDEARADRLHGGSLGGFGPAAAGAVVVRRPSGRGAQTTR